MTTLTPVIFKAKKLKDGSHKIRIAVRHKSITSYIVTRFVVEENQFKNGQVIKRPDASVLNKKIRLLLDEYQERLDAIRNPNLYTCSQLKNMIVCTENEEVTFQKVSDDFLKELKTENRKSYYLSIERVSRYFVEFTQGDIKYLETQGDINLSDITPQVIQNFTSFIRKRGVKEVTVSTLMAQLKSIINRAIRSQLVSYPIHPFVSTKIVSSPVRKLDLTLESFDRIRKSTPDRKKTMMAKDLFLLSFYLGGINLIDLMNIDFRGDKIEYSRSKTKGRMQNDCIVSLTIPEEAKEIINRWMVKRTGKLDFGYKFTYHNFSQYVTYSLQKLAEETGIDERISFYSARKTFAQFASEIGIPDAVIDYCLGHSDKNKGIIRYYTKVRQKQADMAIKRVIDYVSNPDKYKEYIEMKNDIMMMRG